MPRVFVPENRYGLNETKVRTTRVVKNYSTSTGLPTTTQTISADMFQTRHYRASKSSNPVVTLPGKPGTRWRDPSSYSRTIAKVDYFDGVAVHRDRVSGKIRATESGQCTSVGIPNYGPHITSALNVIADTNVDNRVNTEVLLKLKDMKVNYGEALAESRKTVSTIVRTARTLASTVLYARRGKWNKVRRNLGLRGGFRYSTKEIAGRWLEHQYAWLPLMSDIYGTSELLKKGLREKAQLFSVTRTVTTHKQPSIVGTAQSVTGQSTLQTRVKVYARVDDENIHRLTSLGLLDPLQVGWALVPFSFVIDWFLPVGNFLEGLGATRGLTFVGGFQSHRVESETTQVWLPPAITGTEVTGEYLVRTSVFAYRRTKLLSFPPPAFYFKSPFSVTHLVNGIALIRQLFR